MTAYSLIITIKHFIDLEVSKDGDELLGVFKNPQILYCPITGQKHRGVAQPGSAPALGAGGRWFKSSLPDQLP